MQNNTDWLYCHTQIRWESLRNFFPSFEWKPARDNYVNHNVKYLHFFFPGIVLSISYIQYSYFTLCFLLIECITGLYYKLFTSTFLWLAVSHIYIHIMESMFDPTYHILCFCIVFENLNVSICIRKMEGF